jgi:biotin carboxyl carrier protein
VSAYSSPERLASSPWRSSAVARGLRCSGIMRIVRRRLLLLLAVPPLCVVWLTRTGLPRRSLAPAASAAASSSPAVEANGRVYLHEGHVALIRWQGSGRVVRVDASVGDRVRAGTSLAVIEGVVDETGAFDLAAWVSYCEAEAASYGAAAGREAQFRLCMPAGIVLERHAITAPMDGTVIRSTVALHARIRRGAGDPELFQVVDDGSRWVAEADVAERDASRVVPGAPVRIRVAALPGVTLTGEVLQIGAFDPTTRVAKVECSVTSPGLSTAAYASVRILTNAQAAGG